MLGVPRCAELIFDGLGKAVDCTDGCNIWLVGTLLETHTVLFVDGHMLSLEKSNGVREGTRASWELKMSLVSSELDSVAIGRALLSNSPEFAFKLSCTSLLLKSWLGDIDFNVSLAVSKVLLLSISVCKSSSSVISDVLSTALSIPEINI